MRKFLRRRYSGWEPCGKSTVCARRTRDAGFGAELIHALCVMGRIAAEVRP